MMKTYEERTQVVMDAVAHKKKMHRRVAAIVSVSSVCVVVLVLSLVLFLPYATPGGNSPYQSVINALNPIARPYRNNFQKLVAETNELFSVSNGAMRVEDGVAAPNTDAVGNSAAPAKSDESYQENTRNQVDGVREGDLLKQSTNYFYYLRLVDDEENAFCDADDYYPGYWYGGYWRSRSYRLHLDIYSKQGKDSAVVASYTFAPKLGGVKGMGTKEMFLNDACDTLTVVADNIYTEDDGALTAVLTLDISNFDDIKVTAEQYITGYYITSRMTNERLLVVTSYSVSFFDFDDPTTFIPYRKGADGQIALTAAEDITCPDVVNDAEYTVVALFDKGLHALGQKALLGYGDNVYANQEHVYVAMPEYASYYSYQDDSIPEKYRVLGEQNKYRDITTISCLSYGADGLKNVGDVIVGGIVSDQYSMDEYNGVFRVAVSIRTYFPHDYDDYYWMETDKINAGLYCYSVQDWSLVGYADYFAPKDETVRSARFMGDIAYVCTAVQTRDPVFCFDLSDYTDITYTHTGEITGFSMSLTPFADDTLLGVGVDEGWNLKVELYRKGEGSVDSVAKAVIKDTSVVSEYKAYLIDSANGLIAVPAYQYGYESIDEDGVYSYRNIYSYFVFKYSKVEGSEGEDPEVKLTLVETLTTTTYLLNNARSAVADGYAYFFAEDWMEVVAIADLLAD